MNHFKSVLVALLSVFLLTSCTSLDSYVSPLVRAGHRADYITVDKSDRVMSVWENGKLLNSYRIKGMGARPVGHKEQEGDERTPEGLYAIDEKHKSNNFQYFLRISYPNEQDKARAKSRGVNPGGWVGIHGYRDGWKGFTARQKANWTDGCLSIENLNIKELYDLTSVGTPIYIQP